MIQKMLLEIPKDNLEGCGHCGVNLKWVAAVLHACCYMLINYQPGEVLVTGGNVQLLSAYQFSAATFYNLAC